ncbi:AAA family ATPase [Pseudogemmobacter sp. W21_MBD1_M6]|uniref:AAA family ATPase n=1 Tax=Pseudogemmobacter sp. W21_MBD1_M6 TaxID=3240271 RepID=UPI003F9C7D75
MMKMDWSSFTNRISELEIKRKPSANRRAVFEVIRDSKLQPNPDYDASLYLGPLIDPQGRPLCLEYTNDRPNLWFHESHVPALRNAGLDPSRKPPSGDDSEGRHSGLKSKGFQDIDAWKLGDLDPDRTRAALVVLGLIGDLQLDPNAVTRWIDRLRHFFPNLDRFDRPDPAFDEAEREYKLATISRLRPTLESARDDSSIAQAVFAAATDSNNLLDWRTSEPLSAKSTADHALLDPAVASLVRAALASPEGHAEVLDTFARVWREAVPKGTEDAARQIGEFLFFHLWPENAVYIRHTVRQDLWREAVGTPFPKHETLAQSYTDEMRFMHAVRQAFEVRGLAPRDMIDIQSALWVVHNYAIEEPDKSQALDRAQIEAAMDAHDSYRKSGLHSEIFNAFGEPRDYWVRSSRERENRVYPTKPLIGFILSKTELNGGWGQKADAAARLHNAGFIIVDQDDQPIERPERYEHLMEGADRIRLCALNYFIEPAREKAAREVSIRAGDLAAAMGLKNVFPSICDALGKEKFQKLAQVPPPTSTEPNPSSSTVFTYTLNSQPEADAVTDTTKAPAPSAVNLIFYGPPGTGKTYRTAWEAVRLCLGEQIASGLKGSAQRAALMSTYRKLVSEGRVEFVTFHQSMSYEEFVEGLRPETVRDETSDSTTDPSATGGFRLRVEDGVFKRIARRADASRGQNSTGERLSLEGRNVFKMSIGAVAIPEDAGIFDEAITENCAIFGFFRSDFSGAEFTERNAIKARVEQDYTDEELGFSLTSAVQMTDIFRNNLKQGDVVLVSKGNLLIRAIGMVEGDYEFHPREGSETYPHRRAMRWLWVDEAGMPANEFYDMAISQRTIYPLRKKELNIALVERYMNSQSINKPVSPEPHVLIIDEINRANISKVFGELITLLEPDKRLGMDNEIRLTLPYSKKSFGVPQNLHVIGTMNTADRSIALLDTALRRRFAFRELMPNPSVLSNNVEGVDLQKLLATINERIEYLFDREHQIGHAYLTGCETRVDIESAMRDKVIPLLAEYFYEDWSKVAAVLGDSGQGPSRFLDAKQIAAPAGMTEDDFSGDKLRWTVKDKFDFSEFAA